MIQDSFWYLKYLNAPQDIKISHNIIEKLLEVGSNRLSPNAEQEGKLDNVQINLKSKLEVLISSEQAFNIAKLEYEKKELRLLNLSKISKNQLELEYSKKKLHFKDIKSDKIINAIKSESYKNLLFELNGTIEIIKKDTDICYKRIDVLIKLWDDESVSLYNLYNNFEQRGLKYISNNLRLKLIPIIKETESALKLPLIEDARSRVDIQNELDNILKQTLDDIYGELSDSQINMLNQLDNELKPSELVKILKDEQLRNDLIILLDTEKIDIKLTKIIDKLI